LCTTLMYTITNIIDGDSIEVDKTTLIRIAGVDVIGKESNKDAILYMRKHWLYRSVELYDDPRQGQKIVHGEAVKVVIAEGRVLANELLMFGVALIF